MSDTSEEKVKMERRVQAGRAAKASGEMTEALRISLSIASPSVNNEKLEHLLVEAQDLTTGIISYGSEL